MHAACYVIPATILRGIIVTNVIQIRGCPNHEYSSKRSKSKDEMMFHVVKKVGCLVRLRPGQETILP
jgi:hypothetical protein